MSYGVTLTGFVKKTLTDLLDEIQTAERGTIKSTLSLLATNVFGQINGIIGDKLAEVWDLGEAIYASQYPDSASDAALDQVCSITGVRRLSASPSEVLLDRLYLNAGVTVPAGSVVSVGDDGARFVTLVEVTNSTGLKAILSTTAESEDDGLISGVANTIDTIQTPIPGWLDTPWALFGHEPFGIPGPWSAGTFAEVDGIYIAFTLAGTGVILAAAMKSIVESAINAALVALGKPNTVTCIDNGGDLLVMTDTSQGSIKLGTAALAKGFNSLDATLGTEVEKDPALRIRRELLLRALGACTVEAIRARLLELNDVLQVIVPENDTDFTSLEGLPPHSFEAIVRGGDDADIAAVIWQQKAAGIQSFGSETVSVIDSMEFEHEVSFSRPTEIPIYMHLTLTTDSTFPLDGIDQVKAALVEFGDALSSGEHVVALQFKSVPLDVAGVVDVPVFEIDIVDPPTGTSNIPMTFRQLATFDISRITIPNP